MTRHDLVELITSHAKAVVPSLQTHQFAPHERLQDLGANSVDRAEILMLVLESLSLQIPRIELFGAKNIGELADILSRKLDGA
jgi:polyketide biosynthesis acyl carrier protein